jgi:hypothetical protein
LIELKHNKTTPLALINSFERLVLILYLWQALKQQKK